MAVAGLSLALAGCSGDDTFEVPEGFFGATAAEEPRAALIARDLMVAGASAADAAVAMYFALAVTLPSSGGLGANGSCLVFHPDPDIRGGPYSDRRAAAGGGTIVPPYERLSFYPSPASDNGPTVAVPLGPRAMFALHARYGRRQFDELVTIAERLARFGMPVSRALAEDLATDSAVLESDPNAARQFLVNGRPVDQQDAIQQLELAATLSRIRNEGVGALYTGQLARAFAESAGQAGYRVDLEKMRAALPRFDTVTGARYSDQIWTLTGPTRADTALAQVTLDMIVEGGAWGQDAGQNQRLLAQALVQASAATGDGTDHVDPDTAEARMSGWRSASLSPPATPAARLDATLGTTRAATPGATAFHAVDSSGLSVTCAIGTGSAFGTGKMLPGLGFFPGRATPVPTNRPGAFGLLVANTNANQVHLVAHGAGGRPALSAVIASVLNNWDGGQTLEQSVQAPRGHFTGREVLAEQGLDTGDLAGVPSRGVPSLGRSSVFRCVNGLPRREAACDAGADPRSRGLSFFERGS